LGRSRGGLTTKVHLGCEQGQKPLSIVLTAGQRGDSPQFVPVLAGIRVPRPGGGRPRTRPDRVLADKAYTSKANRAHLRGRGIRATIPSKADQDAHRKAKGSKDRRIVGSSETYSVWLRGSTIWCAARTLASSKGYWPARCRAPTVVRLPGPGRGDEPVVRVGL
jgi:hypothetical protein